MHGVRSVEFEDSKAFVAFRPELGKTGAKMGIFCIWPTSHDRAPRHRCAAENRGGCRLSVLLWLQTII